MDNTDNEQLQLEESLIAVFNAVKASGVMTESQMCQSAANGIRLAMLLKEIRDKKEAK